MEKELSISSSKTVFKSINIPSTSKVKISVPVPDTKTINSRFNGVNTETEDITRQAFLQNRDTEGMKYDVKHYYKILKIGGLVLVWLICGYALWVNNERDKESYELNIPNGSSYSFVLYELPKDNKIKVILDGRFLPPYYANLTREHMDVWVQLMVMKDVPTNPEYIDNTNVISLQNVSENWQLPLANNKFLDQIPETECSKVFQLIPYETKNFTYHLLSLQFNTNLQSNFTVSMKYNLQPTNPEDGVLYAALILIILYSTIIFEVIHRTMASILASTISVAALAAYDQRPSMAELISWIDIETLILLFSMMTIVSIFSETGIFDYIAVIAFQKSGGKLWTLIYLLCGLSTLTACFLDTVTAALLVTPITIKLCEVMKINPIQILIYTVLSANIGGAITPIGDPPNVLIASYPDVVKAGVTFGTFTLHMGVGVCITLFVIGLQIKILYRDMKYYQSDEPQEIRDLKREIAAWERTAASVSSYSRDENIIKDTLLKQTAQLQNKLKDTVNNCYFTSYDTRVEQIEDLKRQYPIRNKSLLIKSGITLALVISVFFLNSFPTFCNLGLGWTALLGVILLLLLYDTKDLEGIFARVEWSTLIFFASLFILMEALSHLGLIDWVGKQTQYVITSVGPESRLATALVLILWVSSVVSALVDNLPLATMMIRIAADMSNNEDLHLPLPPLIWAIAFGSCLGGNSTLLGSSSNIICAGVAEQHGYRITFLEFLKVGLPVMLSSTVVITLYLLLCHVILNWQ
ncbi:P protein-like isoform X2 [Diorhabda carinulata]|uniref:P protein-like isoform X2 n=1 Tax=Diorhabda carinulata TaxID=1163345 RepID=UPI0025A01674|nr:P protein-like isoform X2 [Diorhabda carinulata]